jgi:hypothetical protein
VIASSPDRAGEQLADAGLVLVHGPFRRPAEAWESAAELIDGSTADDSLEVLADYVIPPRDGGPSRDFQTLHIDFGLPLSPERPGDVARFTALHISLAEEPTEAGTRFVDLRRLLRGFGWPGRPELLARFEAYGDSHGAWEEADGYVEGSLARIVEAAGGRALLPSVKSTPDFRCGLEFASLAEEQSFFADLGLPVAALEVEVVLEPGGLLLFDNLRLAHGRRGRRRPEELHQRVYGHRDLSIEGQVAVRERFLDSFADPAD